MGLAAGPVNETEALALVIMAWNARRAGETRSKMQLPRGGLTSGELPGASLATRINAPVGHLMRQDVRVTLVLTAVNPSRRSLAVDWTTTCSWAATPSATETGAKQVAIYCKDGHMLLGASAAWAGATPGASND